MIHDLWDVEAGFSFGRFATEAEALKPVRELIDANGEEYADVLELGSPDDPAERRDGSGPALVARARQVARIA